MPSNYDRVFSDAGISEIAAALGIQYNPNQSVGNEGEDSDSFSDYVGSDPTQLIDQPVATAPAPDQNQSLNIPWPISIISTNIKTGQDGSKSVDLVVEFPEITGASQYEYRITPVWYKP